MTKTTTRRAKSSLTMALALAGCAAMLAASSPSRAQDAQSPLRITLDTGKRDFELGEPVYATVTVTNAGSVPTAVFPNLYPEVGVVGIEIAFAGEAPEPFVPLAVDDVETTTQELAPGASLSVVFPIFYGAKGWTFARPGAYTLHATYAHARTGSALSEPVTIQVRPGTGAGSFLLAEGPAGDEAGRFLLWQAGDHLRRGIARLETLIERYPDSVPADHARLALGKSLSEAFRDYSIDRVRPPDYARALELVGPIEVARLAPYPTLQVDLIEARAYSGLGQDDRATAAARRAVEAVRARPAFRSEAELMLEATPALRNRIDLR
jgi:hypothetical protein